MADSDGPRWLLLIHQIPPKPGYLRVKIWRQLQRLGAVAIKNSVYVLPRTDQTYEDFQWVGRAISQAGGDASICEARFVDGLSDEQVEALFCAARDADYAQISDSTKQVADECPRGALDSEQKARLLVDVARLQRRFAEITLIDFFGAPGRDAIHGLLCALEARAKETTPEDLTAREGRSRREELRERVWVTRKGIHVDRMASAWLIQRFIDPGARFKFVDAKGYRPEPGELRFDMFEAEFTHEGDLCTFEVLVERLGLDDPALRALAEIVHDIDLKEAKFGRPETVGVASLVAGIAMRHRDDELRLARGGAVFEDLHEYFRRKKASTEGEQAARAGKDRT
jgi:hypothetical protein